MEPVFSEPAFTYLWDYLGTLVGSWISLLSSYYILLFPFGVALLTGVAGLLKKLFLSKGGV